MEMLHKSQAPGRDIQYTSVSPQPAAGGGDSESAFSLVPYCTIIIKRNQAYADTHFVRGARANARVCFPEPTTRQNRGVLSPIPIPGAGRVRGWALGAPWYALALFCE